MAPRSIASGALDSSMRWLRPPDDGMNSIPAADRKAVGVQFKKEYGSTLASTVDAMTRGPSSFHNPDDLAKVLDALKRGF